MLDCFRWLRNNRHSSAPCISLAQNNPWKLRADSLALPAKLVLPHGKVQRLVSPKVLELGGWPVGIDFLPSQRAMRQERRFIDVGVLALVANVQRQPNAIAHLAGEGAMNGQAREEEGIAELIIAFDPVGFVRAELNAFSAGTFPGFQLDHALVV